MAAVFVLSIPCVLGFNIWSGFSIPGIGGIQDIEDFIVSNNLLPLGSLIYVIFCVSKRGWGWDNFIAEANTGSGIKFPRALRFYVKWILPLIIIAIWLVGYAQKFFLK